MFSSLGAAEKSAALQGVMIKDGSVFLTSALSAEKPTNAKPSGPNSIHLLKPVSILEKKKVNELQWMGSEFSAASFMLL